MKVFVDDHLTDIVLKVRWFTVHSDSIWVSIREAVVNGKVQVFYIKIREKTNTVLNYSHVKELLLSIVSNFHLNVINLIVDFIIRNSDIYFEKKDSDFDFFSKVKRGW